MTFLQPFLLWGLPLVLLPLLIHLFNRMRYRSLNWAAMQFLLTASRQSQRHARLRHILILLMRMLAIGALVFALSRPLVGGWLGWAMNAAPDTIILLLDRSASMETQDAQTHVIKRTQALARFAEALREFEGSSRVVLIDNALRTPQEVTSVSLQTGSSLTGPTDTAADIPALLEAALEYVTANQSGKTEIWLASDLQASNWQPGSHAWESLRTRFAALPQDVRVRLLALTQAASDNQNVVVHETQRQRTAGGFELNLAIEVSGAGTANAAFPLTITHEGARSTVDVRMNGQSLRLNHKLDLGARATAGWGWVELPPDSNSRDNRHYFAYGEDVHQKTLLVAESDASRRILRLAAAPAPERFNQSCEPATVEDAATRKLDDIALVIWQAPLPVEGTATALEGFVNAGGVLFFLPPGVVAAVPSSTGTHNGPPGTAATTPSRFADIGWGDVESTSDEKPFRVGHWRNQDGPLAQTQDGKDLPVLELAILKRRAITGEATALATFEDGKPFLVRKPTGRGAVLFCASLPQPEWSSLDEGTVLLPMVQRLLNEGGRRLSKAYETYCGDESLKAGQASCLSEPEERQAGRLSCLAGVYQVGARIVAVNRPPAEDVPDTIEEPAVRAAFGSIPLRLFEERAGSQSKLQSEVWRWFIFGALVFLTVEAFLVLPGRERARGENRGSRTETTAKVEMAGR